MIFALNRDGIIINNKLLESVSCSELENLPVQPDPTIIDVTGGLKGNNEEMKKIYRLEKPIILVNEMRFNFIKFPIHSHNIRSTCIY